MLKDKTFIFNRFIWISIAVLILNCSLSANIICSVKSQKLVKYKINESRTESLLRYLFSTSDNSPFDNENKRESGESASIELDEETDDYHNTNYLGVNFSFNSNYKLFFENYLNTSTIVFHPETISPPPQA